MDNSPEKRFTEVMKLHQFCTQGGSDLVFLTYINLFYARPYGRHVQTLAQPHVCTRTRPRERAWIIGEISTRPPAIVIRRLLLSSKSEKKEFHGSITKHFKEILLLRSVVGLPLTHFRARWTCLLVESRVENELTGPIIDPRITSPHDSH